MKKSQKQALAVGAGLAAVAATAAGVYMLTGKNAKNRKKVAKWVGDMQKEVVRELDKAGNVTKTTYNKIIDTVARNYEGLKNVNTSDLIVAAGQLKSSWDTIKAEMGDASTAVRRVVPKSVRSVTKKVKVSNGTPTRPAAKKTVKKAASKKTASKRK